MHHVGTGKVLIVDDDQEILTTVGRLLTLEGFDVETALTAEHAFAIVCRDDIGFILSDLRLPARSGVELLRDVRATGRAIPFVILTGYASTASTVEAMHCGAAECRDKPLPPGELIRLVTKYVRGPVPPLPEKGGGIHRSSYGLYRSSTLDSTSRN